jgi:hypothetical protein
VRIAKRHAGGRANLDFSPAPVLLIADKDCSACFPSRHRKADAPKNLLLNRPIAITEQDRINGSTFVAVKRQIAEVLLPFAEHQAHQ